MVLEFAASIRSTFQTFIKLLHKDIAQSIEMYILLIYVHNKKSYTDAQEHST